MKINRLSIRAKSRRSIIHWPGNDPRRKKLRPSGLRYNFPHYKTKNNGKQ